MADTLGIGTPPTGGTGVVLPTAPSALIAEFVTPPPAAAYAAALLAATVQGRGAQGALLVRTVYGTLSLQTSLNLPPGSTLELRLLPGQPPSAALVNVQEPPEPATPPPPMQLSLGTTVDATVRALPTPPGATPAPAGAAADPPPTPLGQTAAAPPSPSAAPPPAGSPAVGAHLLLRIVAPPQTPSASTLLGRVVAATTGETLVETPIGTLALSQRLGLPPDAIVAFEPLEQTPAPTESAEPPTVTTGWPTLDHVLAALDTAAPALAARMRTALMPASGPQLAGTLLFLTAALYGEGWPGGDIGQALTDAGHGRLRAQLSDDVTKLHQLAGNPATGDWRVLVLPLIDGAMVQPVRLYLRRRDRSSRAPPEEESRFIIDVEMSRLGPLQLDGLMRRKRFDLVLRSHRALPEELRHQASAIFHQTLADAGLAGDIAFATASPFAVSPLAGLRQHVQVNV